MDGQKKYDGKLFSILGDSVSTLDGYSIPSDAAFYAGMNKFRSDVFAPEDTWWGQVIERLGGKLLVNNSFSGSTVCRRRGCIFPSYACSDERTSELCRDGQNPDVIMVFIGVNDWGFAVKPIPDDGEEDDLSVFSVAYDLMLQRLHKNYPDAEIWCFTLPVTTRSADESFTFPFRFGGVHTEEYCSVIRACAQKRDCRVIDLYALSLLCPYDTFDKFHPNADGMRRIAHDVLCECE